jgi:hypothetical protein
MSPNERFWAADQGFEVLLMAPGLTKSPDITTNTGPNGPAVRYRIENCALREDVARALARGGPVVESLLSLPVTKVERWLGRASARQYLSEILAAMWERTFARLEHNHPGGAAKAAEQIKKALECDPQSFFISHWGFKTAFMEGLVRSVGDRFGSQVAIAEQEARRAQEQQTRFAQQKALEDVTRAAAAAADRDRVVAAAAKKTAAAACTAVLAQAAQRDAEEFASHVLEVAFTRPPSPARTDGGIGDAADDEVEKAVDAVVNETYTEAAAFDAVSEAAAAALREIADEMEAALFGTDEAETAEELASRVLEVAFTRPPSPARTDGGVGDAADDEVEKAVDGEREDGWHAIELDQTGVTVFMDADGNIRRFEASEKTVYRVDKFDVVENGQRTGKRKSRAALVAGDGLVVDGQDEKHKAMKGGRLKSLYESRKRPHDESWPFGCVKCRNIGGCSGVSKDGQVVGCMAYAPTFKGARLA